MENSCVSKRYRLTFNPERTTKQKINITPRRIVKFTTILCWRQFEAISAKALVVLRINEWLCFLRVPSAISPDIYQSFVRQTYVYVENQREREDSFRGKWGWTTRGRGNVQTSFRTLSIESKLMTERYVDNLIDMETYYWNKIVGCVDMICIQCARDNNALFRCICRFKWDI